MRELHIPRQDQHQLVTRTETIVRRYWSREQRQELGSAPPEDVHPEHITGRTDETAHHSRVERDPFFGEWRQTERLKRRQLRGARQRVVSGGLLEVGVEQAVGIPARAESCAN